MTQEEKTKLITKLITEIEKLKSESIQTLRDDKDKESPMYYSACGAASAYVKVINLIDELNTIL